MTIICINELTVDLRYKELFYLTLDLATDLKIDISQLSKEELASTVFFYFPVNIKNIMNLSPNDMLVLKGKLRANNAVAIIYKMIELFDRFDSFIVLTFGLDPKDLQGLTKFVPVANSFDKGLYLIDIQKINLYPYFRHDRV